MIVPSLKSLLSLELERSAMPEDPSDCCISFQASIGPKDGKGEEIFSFEVVTPQYLARDDVSRWGRGMLVLNQFTWQAVDRSLERLLAHAHKPTWREVAEALNRELLWEFDNYQKLAG